MSIISTFEVDNSAVLAKRFATLAAGYLDQPPVAKEEHTAQVALENIFRLLEMFRYDSFADERRRGVLAFDGIDTTPDNLGEQPWHVAIKAALNQSLDAIYGAAAIKDEAIDQLQGCLRLLASGKHCADAESARTKQFLTEFQARI